MVSQAIRTGIAALALGLATTGEAAAQAPISRSQLARSASFTVTSTLAPQGGSKEVQTFQVEVSGERARLDYRDAALGQVQYLVNEKGVFFFIPANRTAQRMGKTGGIEQALKLTFAQAVEQMRGAKKVGSATISGQPTDIYKNAMTGTTIYMGKKPGFRLPVKMEFRNEGGTRTLLASRIKLNIALPAGRFALPVGTQVIDTQGGPGGLPGVK